MSTRVAVLLGLVAGALVAAVGITVMVAAGPAPVVTAPPLLPSPGPSSSSEPTRTQPAASASSAASPAASAPTGSPGASGSSAFHIGRPAPPLSVPQVGGGTIDLAALRGKPVWVNFMATWCEPCIDEFPRMNGFAARYADEGLVVIAVDVREDEGTVAAFAQRLGATFPMGLDADGRAQDAWGAPALPVHFWVDADGIVRDGALGGIDPELMAAGVGSILPGVEVTP